MNWIISFTSIISFLLFNSSSVFAIEVDRPWIQKKAYVFTSSWFTPAFEQKWEEVLKDFKDQPDVHYLEIGAWEGRSFFWMMDHILTNKSARATVVDNFPPKVAPVFLSNLKKSGAETRVEIKAGLSQEVLPRLKQNSYDIIYIDAGHSLRSVITDAIFAWRLLKPKGILIFDDYLMEETQFPIDLRPQAAIDLFLTAHRGKLELLHKEYQVMVRKLEKDQPWECGSCSYVKGYSYNWYDRKLSKGLLRRETSLNEKEKQTLENMLQQLNLGDLDLEIKSKAFASSESQALLKKLGLRKEDFLLKSVR